MRIVDHPILGPLEQVETITIHVDGRPVQARPGEPIAAALYAAGLRTARFTPKHGEPRGLYCGIGQCTDCVMEVNDVPNVRTCVTPVAEGMKVRTQHGLRGAKGH